MGCLPLPNIISVSPDGRYVVVPCNQDGVDLIVEHPARFVMIDMRTGEMRVLDHLADCPYWINNTAEVVTFSSVRNDRPIVTILRDGRELHVDDAAFPALSDDGRVLVYSAIIEHEGGQETYGLVRRDLLAAETVDLHRQAVLADISPDGARISYVRIEPGPSYQLCTAKSDGSDEKRIAKLDPDTPGTFYPRWLNANTVVYRTRTAESPEDGELFMADLDGRTTQVTDNEVEDAFPTLTADGRLFYMRLPSVPEYKAGDVPGLAVGKDPVPGEIWMATKHGQTWQHVSLGVRAFYFRVAGDQIIYLSADAEGDNGPTLFRAPIANPTEQTNLWDQIKEHGAKLPAAETQAGGDDADAG